MKSRKSPSGRRGVKNRRLNSKITPEGASRPKKSPNTTSHDRLRMFLEYVKNNSFGLPRGKPGRRDNKHKNWEKSCSTILDLALASYYGVTPGKSDYDICLAWARAAFGGPDSEDARIAILVRVSRAIKQQDEIVFHQLLHACKSIKEKRPKFPLEFALVKARLVLWYKGRETPSKAELVKEAMSYFHAKPFKTEEFESLEKTLFRTAGKIYEALLRKQ